MKKEPALLYLLRLLLMMAAVAILAMLYWSSTLVEDQLHSLRSDITGLKSEVTLFGEELNAIQGAIYTASTASTPSSGKASQPIAAANPNIDESLPNLLEDDPFYATTLPKILGNDFKPKGTRRQSTLGKPENLHPFSLWRDVSIWLDYCSVTLTQLKFGIYETMAPHMATRMEERVDKETQEPEYWLFLRDDIFWQPLKPSFFGPAVKLPPHFFKKYPVTAHDFKFWFDAMMNPYNQEPGALANRTLFSDIKEVKVVDDHTLIVRWKTALVDDGQGNKVPKMKYVAKLYTGGLRPLARWVYQYFSDGKKILEDDSDADAYRQSAVWAQNMAQHWAKNIIVSCGPYTFDGMTEREIRFKRTADFYNPLYALTEGINVEFKNSADNMWQDFKANITDLFPLPPQQLADWENFQVSDLYKKQEAADDAIERLDYLSRSFYYIGWNQNNPLFKSKVVRRAMTMAIDRDRIVDQNVNGMGVQINGPFYRYSKEYDDSIELWPFDPSTARHLLEEEGWYDSDGDGIIDKVVDGKRRPFSFSLTYYVKSSLTKSICEYIATALKEIGVQCQLKGVDMADLSAEMDDKSFDAVFMGWGLGAPPEDLRQIWSSAGAKEKGSSNIIAFQNAEVDAIIDKLDFESNAERRLKLYHRFARIIHEEQPYTFLLSSRTALLFRQRLQNVFIPADRQDIIPGATVSEPIESGYWLKL